MKKIYVRCFCVLLLSLLTMSTYAQKTVTGTVKDAGGDPLPAVSVMVKGTKLGTNTDGTGRFSISAPANAVLVFRYLGFKIQETAVGTSGIVNVVLLEDKNDLSEVVVTALGIQREKKSLGYAVQEVKGSTLVETREPNLVNTLSGKVAGLQVTRSSNGPAGSSKITLRGNNSLTGDNQPLIVVDGIPLNNFTGNINPSSGVLNNDYYNPAIDMGNGLSDINPEDIESISVLKGPSASALYGSRAGNGVIMVTTKSGKLQKGLGITVSSTLGIESVFTNPKLQGDFGQGTNGVFDKVSDLSWGPKISGQSVAAWNGDGPLRSYDNIGNYVDQGISSNQSVSFQQQVNSTSVYTSFNKLDDKSIIPGAELHRTNLLARATSKFGKDDRWVTDTKIQYTNSKAENRPNNGANVNNVFATLYNLPRSLDITQFNPSTDRDGKMIWYNPTSTDLNPYWAKQYNLNQDVRDRYVMNGSVKYNFNSWLNAELKGGADSYSTTVEGKLYGGSPSSATGQYSLSKETFTETNFSALISGRKDNVFGRLGGAFSAGGNLMSQENSILGSSSGQLVVPNLFSLNNGINSPTVSQTYRRKKINSVYGTAQLNWDGYLFLDGTFRNDWSSTLSPSNRSFFYPSVSLSYVVTEMFTKMGKTLPTWLSFAKLRASYATVGNDLGAYQLYNTYNIGKDPNGNTTASRNGVLFDENVVNELIKSFEAGAEMRFLNGRFGFDLSFYKSNATNQLIDLPLDPLSGYSSKKINAGNIQNKGVELMVDANILSNPNSLNWNLSANYSHNDNTVKYLSGDVSQYRLGGYDDISILAVAGGKYGEIYGSKFLRVNSPGSALDGQLLLDANGLPQRGEQNVKLGNQQADALIGITNTFGYKGFNLSFLVDGRFGGKIFSGTLAQMQENGTANNTVVNGLRDNMVAAGAVLNTASNTYEANTHAVSPQQYWSAVAGVGNLGITEANLYDATNIRLRNVNLSYNISPKLLAKTFVQRAKIGVSCNNVWLITSHLNGIDPESVFATGGNAVGFENSSPPTTRTFSFNLTLGF
ncbi:SusC/RagA family TonB-linked outer membrane protein [Pedobacter hartonius]|uniref:TonB-linked outer membrane protein, SusC/RagA family n=1 Tax=Pedobacter hartonius TaxID=425514 RepID=A0A1H4DS15_9SPHI|nr:SusC/RagA family TonB-linked outer membrane protein [Pedobacter hartonius]SEA75366.1 TonB-linked outer membrane protein, SusC/RagA family [Pedobacter hartonius]